MNNLITFYTDKSFLIFMFLFFISCLKCYPAERLHLFKLTWGKTQLCPVCTTLSVLLPKPSELSSGYTTAVRRLWGTETRTRSTTLLPVSPKGTRSIAQHALGYLLTLIKLVGGSATHAWGVDHLWRDSFLPNIHILSKYLTAVL